jgi:hypothetical protein
MPTPSITPQYTPVPELIVELEMPSHYFREGDICWLTATITSMRSFHAPFVVLLDVGTGEYWFYPSWVKYPESIDYVMLDLHEGVNGPMTIIPEFTWPAVSRPSPRDECCYFYAAVLSQDFKEIISNLAEWCFQYGP